MYESFLVFPNLDPILFSLGPFSIRWYGLMYLVGFIFAICFAKYRVRCLDIDWTSDQISDLLFISFISAILGGRIGYVLFYKFNFFLNNPLYIFKIWMGGMSFHGGLLGVISAIFWYSKKNKCNFWSVADFVAPLVPFGLGMGRIGNFINSELWGRVTDVPWAIIFPNGGNLPRHPSQLYEFFLEGLVLFLIINWFTKKTPPVGSVSGLFLVGYATFRFFIEYFREPDEHLGLFFGYTTMGQILSLPMFIIGILIILYSYIFFRKQQV
ncbi:prolipoprotein diacylglyceryl transferase [Candidatus Photodesmus katoptron]|uniref:Phosphatidylglycerol--prolipoprotein diacylglyceryl transferase n=1 Tax=Candidatus Photodesmus katoptron Akat1 TaxID=1236703 RepID=S3DJJ8_9GAMM|nr:prolipoprotein diacylglyceryl transferase [Candidatus Photodesmus katoptron]EPE37299.1 prolipoprotein diacylglyceryl transferase [Candidatus Photodesmus katoptron Akat1]KEY90030.1 prolipoprotein diacylglyceryl transferase [Candidatus Photodesmus katoptron]